MPGIIDSKTGKSIIHGKTVTGFTIEGELIFRILDKLRADGVVPIVEAVTAAGAFYSGSVGAFDDYSITSGRVVTGTNPASGRSAAERGVKLFDNLRTFITCSAVSDLRSKKENSKQAPLEPEGSYE